MTDFTCPNSGGIDCAGVIDCEASVASFKAFIRNSDETDGAQVTAINPNISLDYNFYIDWVDCNGDFVAPPLPQPDGPLSVTNSNGFETFEGTQANGITNKYHYVASTTSQQSTVDLQWGSFAADQVSAELCTLSIPFTPFEQAENIHLGAGQVLSKDALTIQNTKINDTTTGGTVIYEDLYIPANAVGAFQAHARVRNKDHVIFRRCCIEGVWDVNDPDQVFGVNGIDCQDCTKVTIQQCQVSGFYDCLFVADADRCNIDNNNLFNANGHHIFLTRHRNTVAGDSWVRNNFCWYTGPGFDDNPASRSVDLINIFDPIWQPHAHIDVAFNYCRGFKRDNGVSVIVDGRFRTSYVGQGLKFGKTSMHDNVVLWPANRGVGISFGTDCRMEDNCVLGDIPWPTATGVQPTSGGLAFGIREVTKPVDAPDPNFGGHYAAGNIGHALNTNGQDGRFFAPVTAHYTLGPGNNFPPNFATWAPTLSRQQVHLKGLQNVTGVPCFL